LHTNLLSTISGSFTYSDSSAATCQDRFYRAIYQP
jgi:hypothetical protein